MIDVVVGDGPADRIAVPVFADRRPGPGAETLLGAWERYLDAADFTGKAGQVVTIPGGAEGYVDVLLVGVGEDPDAEALRRAAAAVARASRKVATVATTLHHVDVERAAEAVVVGYLLGSYRFDRYRNEPEDSVTGRLRLLGEADEAHVEAARVVASATALARDLVNEPASALGPEELAAVAVELHPEVVVEVLDEAACRERRLGGVLAVGSGSGRPPRLVIVRYEPTGAEATLALVGKGIVFDSGGLSLKPAQAMETMKTDMAGAAAVLAATRAIAELSLPVRVVTIAPLAENMPGGDAQRPGDVIRTYAGKTIEVLNTDAEGRLVLADGLALATEEDPDLIVDVATLTGACKVALGPRVAGLLGNDEAAVERVEAAAADAGEPVWRLPLEDRYRELIDSDVADMKNTGGRWGGAIIAALLLREFVEDRPWVHLDVAGPARAEKDDGYVTKGGTGFGVRTLVELARRMAGVT